MTTCADRRGPALESRPARKSLNFGPRRKSAISRRHCWGNPEIGISGSRQDVIGGGLSDSGGACSDVSVACQQGVSGENGVQKLTPCADRLGSAVESRPAYKSPDFGPARKSAFSGDIVRDIRKSGSRQDVYWIPAARFLTFPSRVSKRASGENGVRKLTTCADRRGPAFEHPPARKSPDFGPVRKYAISGDIVGDARESGFRDLVRTSWGGLLDSGSAFRDVSVACFTAGYRRKRGPKTDQPPGPAGERI